MITDRLKKKKQGREKNKPLLTVHYHSYAIWYLYQSKPNPNPHPNHTDGNVLLLMEIRKKKCVTAKMCKQGSSPLFVAASCVEVELYPWVFYS